MVAHSMQSILSFKSMKLHFTFLYISRKKECTCTVGEDKQAEEEELQE